MNKIGEWFKEHKRAVAIIGGALVAAIGFYIFHRKRQTTSAQTIAAPSMTGALPSGGGGGGSSGSSGTVDQYGLQQELQALSDSTAQQLQGLQSALQQTQTNINQLTAQLAAGNASPGTGQQVQALQSHAASIVQQISDLKSQTVVGQSEQVKQAVQSLQSAGVPFHTVTGTNGTSSLSIGQDSYNNSVNAEKGQWLVAQDGSHQFYRGTYDAAGNFVAQLAKGQSPAAQVAGGHTVSVNGSTMTITPHVNPK